MSEIHQANDVFEDLRQLFGTYHAFNEEERDSLGTTVIKQTLEKMFVHDILQGDTDHVPDTVALADDVHPYLLDPSLFKLASFDIHAFDRTYGISLTADDSEHTYAYQFKAIIRRFGKPAVDIKHAEIMTGQTC